MLHLRVSNPVGSCCLGLAGLFVVSLFTVGSLGCRVESAKKPSAKAQPIVIDGSSTVYPISQSMAEGFHAKQPAVHIQVGLSGTGGGFKKFIKKEIDICDASRPITASEIEQCQKAGVEYVELKVAIDALTVLVNPKNQFVQCLTVEQLKTIWKPNSGIQSWKDLDPSWPDQKLQLFGADTDSGTFDYFTEVIVGKSKESRTDYTPASNDNVLVSGISNNEFALGYFGYSYYVENKDRLKALAIKQTAESDCVLPSPETIDTETYKPLARPLYIYINRASLARPEVTEFARYFLSDAGQERVLQRKFIPLNAATLAEARQRLEAALSGASASPAATTKDSAEAEADAKPAATTKPDADAQPSVAAPGKSEPATEAPKSEPGTSDPAKPEAKSPEPVKP